MFRHVNFSDWLRWTLVFLAVALSIAYLNRNHNAEPGILTQHHIPMAEHLLGGAEREITTYPMWGYALLIGAVGSNRGLVMFQSLASSAALALFLLVLRGVFPLHRKLLLWVLMPAVPWYCLHTVRWPDSPAAALALASGLALLHSCETKRLSGAVVGGLLLGLSMNFRSDKLLLPLAIGLLWLAGRALRAGKQDASGVGNAPSLDLRSLLAFACASWLLLLPWAIHYHAETGRYSLTSSNQGMVAFISLGQLPGNPWGVQHNDAYANWILLSASEQAPALSDAGSRALLQRFRQHVASNPGSYARKVAQNLRSMLMAGFYVGDSKLSSEENLQLDLMRERVKLALGVNPNLTQIAHYKRTGVWETPPAGGRALAQFAWQLVGGALGALFLLIALAGMISAPRRTLGEPLLLICAAFVLYQIAMVGALQYQPRHMNAVFVFLVPFFVIAMERAAGLMARLRRPSDPLLDPTQRTC